MGNIDRYVFSADGPDVESIARGFMKAIQLSGDLDESRNILLLVSTKDNLRGTTLETVLGSPISKTLLKGKEARLPNGKYLRLATKRTFNDYWTEDIIFAVYASKELLDLIDGIKSTPAIVVIPWLMEDVEQWIRTWEPYVDGEKVSSESSLIENPVVEEGLKMLTNSVNLSTGLSHPSDKAAAVHLFRQFYKYREIYDSDSIRAWALRNDWSPKGADQLHDIAQAILDRRRIQAGKTPSWGKDIISLLRERAGIKK